MDEKINVKVNGVIHIYATSNVTILPLERPDKDGNLLVAVSYAGKDVRGTVSQEGAKKLFTEEAIKERIGRIKEEEEYPVVVIDKPKRRDS